MRSGYLVSAALSLVVAAASPALGQQKLPAISQRSFTEGSVKVVVTGSFSIDQDIPINKAGSFGDGEMTWLQFGNPGGTEPNVGITFNAESGEVGITVARGKQLATGGIMPGEKSECAGKVDVTMVLVSGRYTCTGVTSHDPATGRMGKVNIEVVITAKS